MFAHPVFLLLCFVGGIMLRQVKYFPPDLYRKINKFIIWLPLPCITLVHIPGLEIGLTAIIPIASAWLIFAVALLFFSYFSNFLHVDKSTWACLVLVCGLGNTSFVGYPVLKAIYGNEAIPYAILVDQPGTFLALSTVGVVFVLSVSQGRFSLFPILKRLFTFPPFLSFLVALILPSAWFAGKWMLPVQFTGNLMVPLALLSIGMQFSASTGSIEWKYFIPGIAYKLIIAPAIIFCIVFIILGQRGMINNVTVMECAMPPMITASVLASEYDLNPPLANALATWGIPLSAITLFLWQLLLAGV